MIFQLATLLLVPSAEAEIQVRRDIPYWKGDEKHPTKNKLDLYLPAKARGFPVLFFVHGGAWMHGDKNFLGVYSSLGKSFGFLLTSAAVSRGVPFVVNVLVAHRLTPQQYGVPTVHFALVRRQHICPCQLSACARAQSPD